MLNARHARLGCHDDSVRALRVRRHGYAVEFRLDDDGIHLLLVEQRNVRAPLILRRRELHVWLTGPRRRRIYQLSFPIVGVELDDIRTGANASSQRCLHPVDPIAHVRNARDTVRRILDTNGIAAR